MDISDIYMSRCLELATHGKGSVAPNPMVGAVIVADGVIIGEGFHRCYGEAHAEVNAIASVKDKALLRRSTMYVNLEPCSHYGKTPSCAELIIRQAIPRVVIACLDPNPKVAGRGIKMLHEAGVAVTTGVREQEAAMLNRFFMTAHLRHRPYIILKCAQSEDGFIDGNRKEKSDKPVVFSNAITRMMAHQLRSEVQAIMVGTNTAVLDNPALTVRAWTGKSPVRILVDRNLRVPQGYRLLDGKHQTFVFTIKSDILLKKRENIRYYLLDESDFKVSEIASILFKNDVHSLLVEGGALLHRSFIEENLWDELIVETAPIQLKEGVRSAFSMVSDSFQITDRQCIYSGIPGLDMPSLMERYFNYTF